MQEVLTESAEEKLPLKLQEDLQAAMSKRLGELTKDKNAAGKKFKRHTYSQDFKRVDDSTVKGTFHIDSAGDTEMTTQRYLATISKEGGKWTVSSEELKDTQNYLSRKPVAVRCGKFNNQISWCVPSDELRYLSLSAWRM